MSKFNVGDLLIATETIGAIVKGDVLRLENMIYKDMITVVVLNKGYNLVPWRTDLCKPADKLTLYLYGKSDV
jgi:hypothetical protein